MHKGLSLTLVVVLGCGNQVSTPDDPALQGELVPSALPTSLAISGNGFFVLSTPTGLRFTRRGDFSIGPDGFLETARHDRVQGLNAARQLQALGVSTGSVGPQQTTTIVLDAKLDPNAAIQTFDPLNPVNTSNFNASVTIFDSRGRAHDLTVFFNRIATGAWDWRALVPDGSELTGGTAGVPSEVASGTVTFDTEGRLESVTQNSTFNPVGAINPQPLRFEFGDDLSSGGTGLEGVVQKVSENRNELIFTSQDGTGPARLTDLVVDSRGRAIAGFSNGSTRDLGSVALANFAYPPGLHREADDTFAETSKSGHAIIGAQGDFLFGTIRGQMLEQPPQP